VLDLVLGMGFRPHFFDEDSMICPTLAAAGLLRGREGEGAAALALDHDALGTPPVDLAHLYLLDLVTRFDALYNLRHFFPRFPFPASVQRKNDLPLSGQMSEQNRCLPLLPFPSKTVIDTIKRYL
jgi:hypothetical protein